MLFWVVTSIGSFVFTVYLLRQYLAWATEEGDDEER